ncbi:hypothetical protein D3C81_190590 [compost metagenome]
MTDNTVKLNPEHLVMLEKPGEKLKTYPRLTKLIVDSNYSKSPGAMKGFTAILARPESRKQINAVIEFFYHNRHALKKHSVKELLDMEPLMAFGLGTMGGFKSKQPDGTYRNPLDKEYMWPYTRLSTGPTVEMRIPKARQQGGVNHFTYNPELRILDKE